MKAKDVVSFFSNISALFSKTIQQAHNSNGPFVLPQGSFRQTKQFVVSVSEKKVEMYDPETDTWTTTRFDEIDFFNDMKAKREAGEI